MSSRTNDPYRAEQTGWNASQQEAAAKAARKRYHEEEPFCLNCERPQPHAGAHYDGTEFTCEGVYP